jgi:N-acetylmuramoyl-L-alanine amidase
MKRVCLDAGHGGNDVGALGPSGLKESEMALDVCERAQFILSPYVEVVMTRSNDTFVSLTERADICNAADCDIFISYHFNAATSMVANGWEIFTTKKDNNSDKLATCIGEAHAALFPTQNARQDWSDGDLDKEADFSVIRRANCPAVLMEGEFIHTALGEELINDPINREKMARAIADGSLKYLGLQPITSKPALTLEERIAIIEKTLGIS